MAGTTRRNRPERGQSSKPAASQGGTATGDPLAASRAMATARRSGRLAAQRRQRQQTTWLLGGASALVIVIVIVVAVIVSSNQSSSGCADEPSNLLKCGTAAPNFTLPQVPGGNKVSLSSFRGHPVLMELFATWCPHCQRSAPLLENLDAANKKKGVVMISVLADGRNHLAEANPNPGPTSVADVEWFINTFHVKHTVLYDPNVVSSPALSVASIYGLTSFPTLYLIDKQGIIRWANQGEVGPVGGNGYVGLDQIQAQINKLL